MPSTSNTRLQKAPFVFQSLRSHMPFNQKYAPKFVNHLDIYNKNHLPLRTKYIKKISKFFCSDSPIMRKITKRFTKYCKGFESLNPKILSSLSSLELSRLDNFFQIPLYFKLGRFQKLLLSYKTDRTPRNPSEISQQASNIVAKIKRSRHIKNLKIEFGRETVDISTSLLLQFEKYPQRLSSFQSFALDYNSSRQYNFSHFSNSLAHLKNMTQTITHLSVRTSIHEEVNINLQDFRRLNSLSLDLESHKISFIKRLMSLAPLTNLEAFHLKIRPKTSDEIDNFLMNFKPPKSVKTLSLNLIPGWGHLLPLAELLKENKTPKQPSKKSAFDKLTNFSSTEKPNPETQYQILESSIKKFFEEEWSPAKKFYEKWSHLDKLSHLALDFFSSPEESDLSFFFLAPILKRCHHLKSLALSTCYRGLIDFKLAEHQKLLHWNHILQVLKPSKDTLEKINILVPHMNFDDQTPSNFTFKNLKSINFNVRKIETKPLSFIQSILPRAYQESKFYGEIIFSNEKQINEFFAYLKSIPKDFQVHFVLSLSGIISRIFERKLVHYLASARIEGSIVLQFYRVEQPDLQQLKESLADKAINLGPTGVLKIDSLFSGTILEARKPAVVCNF